MDRTAPIDADTITEPLVFCTLSGGYLGWFHCDVRTTAKSLEEARKAAEEFLKGVFPGRHKLIREHPNANEQRNFEYACREVRGFARFSFRLEEGPTEEVARSEEIQFHGFGR